jgi:hypothetical protein
MSEDRESLTEPSGALSVEVTADIEAGTASEK